MSIDAATLADRIGGRLEGECRDVRRLATAANVGPGAVVVAGDAAAIERVLAAPDATQLAALLVSDDAELPDVRPPVLRHPDPRLALALLSALLDDEPVPAPGIAVGAHVDPSAQLAGDVRVGSGAVVGADAKLAEGVIVDAGAHVGAGCELGPASRIFPRAVLYPGVRVGARVRVHAGAVIGADGFGYAPGPAGATKIHHLGSVVLGDDVEIGANTCIDRGTIEDTHVGDGSKIDNLCQIGHNVRIGRHCLIAGTVAIGGSTVVEDGVQIGGGAATTDHVRIGAGARIAGRAGVTKDVPAGEAWGGLPAAPMRDWARERYLIARLERIWAFVRAERKRADAEDA